MFSLINVLRSTNLFQQNKIYKSLNGAFYNNTVPSRYIKPQYYLPYVIVKNKKKYKLLR